MVPSWKRVLTPFFGFKTPNFFWLAYLIPLTELRVPVPYGQPPWKFSWPLSYSRPASGTLLLQNNSHISLLLVSTLRSWPLALCPDYACILSSDILWLILFWSWCSVLLSDCAQTIDHVALLSALGNTWPPFSLILHTTFKTGVPAELRSKWGNIWIHIH